MVARRARVAARKRRSQRGTTSAFDEANIEVILKAMDLIADD